MVFSLALLVISEGKCYNSTMLKRIEISLFSVVKNSVFDRLNSTAESVLPANCARAFIPACWYTLRIRDVAARSIKVLSSGFDAAWQRSVYAAFVRQPGTRPCRLRSAAF